MKRSRTAAAAAIRRAGNCPTCKATGQVAFSSPHYFKLIDCPACEGSGRA